MTTPSLKTLVRALPVLFAPLLLTQTAVASSLYPAGTTGHDISYPNTTSTPSSGAFGIVGVTGGRAFTHNSYFSSQYAWASSYTTAPSTYMNLNAAIGSTSSKGMTGPDGSCGRNDKVCLSFNYGYNAAQDAYTYAGTAAGTSSMWWLDIETANSWSSNTSLNRHVIDGAAAFFQGGVAPNGHTVSGVGKPVGVYSTPSMWQSITGGYSDNLPAWTATGETSSSAASGHCSQHAFTNASTYLVQYSDGSSFDADYACP